MFDFSLLSVKALFSRYCDVHSDMMFCANTYISLLPLFIGIESEPESTQPMELAQPPSFFRPVTNTIVPEMSSACFEAMFSGYPTPSISWIRNGMQTLHESKDIKVHVVAMRRQFYNLEYKSTNINMWATLI